MADTLTHGVHLHHQRLGRRGASVRLVFVHGLVVDNLASWYFSVACAAATFADVLTYDLRGHGRSERPKTGYGVGDMVLDLAGLLDATLGSAPVCLVGNSFGALVALEFARRFPSRAAGLVLVDGHIGHDGFAERMAETLSLRGAEADRAIARTFEHWPGQTSPRKRAKLVEQARALVLGTSLVDDLKRTPALGAGDFAKLATPTLALYGERSDIVAASAPLLASMPNGEIQVLEGCTHSVLWEATDEVRARILAFCRRLESRGAA
jgi:pimeloyl-ACP methyl ester carboxylesterase